MRILLATNNPHKAGELAAILAETGDIEVMTLGDLPAPPGEPVEDGDTLESNAYIKAREIFAATGIPTIADDTGLEVTGLAGAPGVRSARFAGESATYADNCEKLTAELAAIPDANRTARFRTVICYTDGMRTLFAEGSVEGEIVGAPRGEGGFGYDPLFRPYGSDRTFAEMSSEEKNRISHRGLALASLRAILDPYLRDQRGTGDQDRP